MPFLDDGWCLVTLSFCSGKMLQQLLFFQCLSIHLPIFHQNESVGGSKKDETNTEEERERDSERERPRERDKEENKNE